MPAATVKGKANLGPWAQGYENGSCSATTLAGSTALPFVISTGAPKERSGEICGSAVISWKCFSCRARFHQD
jgi:hypothetical protein